ncbi:hypothetical protein GCM10022224_026110 [Nonomuraea antimicrobica]|uniref:Uncharacterized protein n=1 Tax=Nonomuraea antimicrobica TaxID=561173 RepID=A0ABP7BKC7_9ACTN
MQQRDSRWEKLPSGVRDRIDGLLCSRRLLEAIWLLRSEGGLDPTPDLHEAQLMLGRRSILLAEHGLVDPAAPPVQLSHLIERAHALSEPVAAIEALWDGDSWGWFVVLVAIVRQPGREHRRFDERALASIRRGTDLRAFNGEVPPWPEAIEAVEKGWAVARSLGVPFHFTNPDAPDIDPPRWWDAQAD